GVGDRFERELPGQTPDALRGLLPAPGSAALSEELFEQVADLYRVGVGKVVDARDDGLLRDGAIPRLSDERANLVQHARLGEDGHRVLLGVRRNAKVGRGGGAALLIAVLSLAALGAQKG